MPAFAYDQPECNYGKSSGNSEENQEYEKSADLVQIIHTVFSRISPSNEVGKPNNYGSERGADQRTHAPNQKLPESASVSQ